MSSNICKNCSQNFEITDADKNFYNRIKVPEPTHCPDCRQQRRLAWRNERNLYKRKCNHCGKPIISIYDESSAYKVFCLDCWWSDKWDPKTYSKDYDFNRPFFEQFSELQKQVPHMALLQENNENSEYTSSVSHLKDCYLLFSADFNRNCYYGTWVERCKDCVDNYLIDSCELTYESIFSNNLYNSIFVLSSSQCMDSAFLFDCKGCSNCFMCYNLRNKKFYIENKQYSQEEYFNKLKEFNLSSYTNFLEIKKRFFDFIKGAVYLYIRKNGRLSDSTGDFLTNVENCKNCYEILDSKDCAYIQGGFGAKDIYDSSYVNGEFGYENLECVPMPFNSAFNMNTYSGNDLFYCDSCFNGNKNLFGCVGLRHGEYSILNKQYPEPEYKQLTAKIIEQMKQTGEWGEFFPIKFSPFAYNETNSQEIFPLTKEQALAKVYKWKDPDNREYKSQTYQIPDEIKEVPDSITQEILSCKDCGKNYKIIPQELKFYKQIGLPIPRNCPDCRHNERLKFRNPRKLWERNCVKCGASIKTSYAPERPEKVYCEKCYLEEVY